MDFHLDDLESFHKDGKIKFIKIVTTLMMMMMMMMMMMPVNRLTLINESHLMLYSF